MNELSEIISRVSDGDTVVLENGKTYAIAPEDSFHIFGMDFSNTAKKSENPDGERLCGIFLENKKNVTIDGNGATVMIHGVMTPFIFRNCENIIFRNLTIDHFRPTMSEFIVLESEPGRALIRINPEFRYRIDGNMLYWMSEDAFDGKPYWEIPYRADYVATVLHNPDNTFCFRIPSLPEAESICEHGEGIVEFKFKDSASSIPKAGSVLQSRNIVRSQTGGAVDGCRNVVLENLRIMSINCFGILSQNTENVSLINLDCTPKEGRTCTSDADFFHFSGCSGKILIDGCKAAGAHDDVMNIHGTHLRIVDIDRNKNKVLLRYSHGESWGFEPYAEGDEVEFVSGNLLLPYHSAKVLEVKKLSCTDFEVTFDSVPECTPAVNDVVENITRTAELEVRNCEFYSIPTRGILVTTRKNVLIKNNIFRYMLNPVLLVADDANYWFESGRSVNVRFEGNTVIDCGTRDGQAVIEYHPEVMDKESKAPVHKKLEVINNRFINTMSSVSVVRLNYVETAVFEGNEWNTDVRYECNDTVNLIK